jgi:thioredoxin-like negative regulator of GroEL
MGTDQNSAIAWVGEENFEAEALIPNDVVLVAFLAPWCRAFDLIVAVHKVPTTCAEQVKVIKVNADHHPALNLLYHITSIPTQFLFVNGTLRERAVGTVSAALFLSKLQSISFIDEHQPSARKSTLRRPNV